MQYERLINVPFSICCFQNKYCYLVLTADDLLIGVCWESTKFIVSCRVTRHRRWAAFGLYKASLTSIAFYSGNRIQKDRSLRIINPCSQDHFGARRFLLLSNSPVITVRLVLKSRASSSRSGMIHDSTIIEQNRNRKSINFIRIVAILPQPTG